jgi:hypothetical protein
LRGLAAVAERFGCGCCLQAVVVDPPAWLPPTTSASTHITISVAAGIKPVEAGLLVKDALLRMALTDPGSAGSQGSAGGE